MADPPEPIGELARDTRGKQRGVLPGGWFPRGSWKAIDPLYIWSAAVGFVLALALIAVAQIMRTGRLH